MTAFPAQMRAPLLGLLVSGGLVLAAACEAEPDEIEVIDLGTVSLSDTGGYSGAIDVELPPLTTSVMAYCGGYGDDTVGAVWTLTDPSGATVYDGDGDTSRWRSDFIDDLASSVLPVSPRLPASEGIWKFDWFVGAGNGGTLDCGAVIRSGLGDDVGSEATIQVEFVMVGSELTAASAPDDPDWQAALDTFESEWATGGLTISASYEDFGGNAANYAIVDIAGDDYRQFNDLLRTADPVDPRTMTIFLVDEITADDGDTVLGLSGGPPGAATLSRTSKSGVVISTTDLRSAPGDVGKIMAHEGAHFLGLFHPTESDASNNDPIGDTPECTDDANGDGLYTASECPGSNNVMFWTITDGPSTFTADQGWVLRRNPLAY